MTESSCTRFATAAEIITAAAPSTVTTPNHEPRASARTPASAIRPKMITIHPLCGPSNPLRDTGPATRHVPNTPTIANTIAALQIHATERSLVIEHAPFEAANDQEPEPREQDRTTGRVEPVAAEGTRGGISEVVRDERDPRRPDDPTERVPEEKTPPVHVGDARRSRQPSPAGRRRSGRRRRPSRRARRRSARLAGGTSRRTGASGDAARAEDGRPFALPSNRGCRR